jgi:hypothetical protein
MDSLTGLQDVSSELSATQTALPVNLTGYLQTKTQANALIVSTSLSGGSRTPQDASSFSLEVDDLYKGLSISAQEILSKLNDILKGKLPNGIESLKPEDVTPERTADAIVGGISAFFSAYAKSNSDLAPEELVSRFFEAARKGVEKGYGDATSTLESLGAFEFIGVKDGVSKTKELLDQKLNELEVQKRRELGLDTTSNVEKEVSDGILAFGGGAVVAASARQSQSTVPLNIAA